MREFIYPEMMVHIPLCTNKSPKDILVVSDDEDAMVAEIKKHDKMNITTIKCSLDAVRELSDNAFDVVICEIYSDSAILAHINRALRDDGQLTLSHPSLDNAQENKNLMQVLGNYFKVIMPYNLGDNSTALLASKEYHPTADIILQRADMLDNLNYYNCDIHIASFAMPNYIRKEYLGIIKN